MALRIVCFDRLNSRDEGGERESINQSDDQRACSDGDAE